MTICSEGHEEVCHESRKCPACELAQELSSAKDEIEGLREDVRGLEKEINNHECPKEGL